jgi:hypothetical protein
VDGMTNEEKENTMDRGLTELPRLLADMEGNLIRC